MLEKVEKWPLFLKSHLFLPALLASLRLSHPGCLGILYLRACVCLTSSSDYRSVCLPFSIYI